MFSLNIEMLPMQLSQSCFQNHFLSLTYSNAPHVVQLNCQLGRACSLKPWQRFKVFAWLLLTFWSSLPKRKTQAHKPTSQSPCLPGTTGPTTQSLTILDFFFFFLSNYYIRLGIVFYVLSSIFPFFGNSCKSPFYLCSLHIKYPPQAQTSTPFL